MLRDEEQHQLCGHPPQRRGNRKVSLGKQLHLMEGKNPLKKDKKNFVKILKHCCLKCEMKFPVRFRILQFKRLQDCQKNCEKHFTKFTEF